jgi:HSP20 family protein
MNTMSLFEPMREGLTLREAINRLFEDSFVSPAHVPMVKSMTMDAVETPDAIVVTVSMPGCDKDKCEIHFQNDTLTIKADMTQPELPEGQRYLLRERFNGQNARSLTLPLAINADKAKAEYKDGILTLTLPKADSVKPRTIKIG